MVWEILNLLVLFGVFIALIVVTRQLSAIRYNQSVISEHLKIFIDISYNKKK